MVMNKTLVGRLLVTVVGVGIFLLAFTTNASPTSLSSDLSNHIHKRAIQPLTVDIPNTPARPPREPKGSPGSQQPNRKSPRLQIRVPKRINIGLITPRTHTGSHSSGRSSFGPNSGRSNPHSGRGTPSPHQFWRSPKDEHVAQMRRNWLHSEPGYLVPEYSTLNWNHKAQQVLFDELTDIQDSDIVNQYGVCWNHERIVKNLVSNLLDRAVQVVVMYQNGTVVKTSVPPLSTTDITDWDTEAVTQVTVSLDKSSNGGIISKLKHFKIADKSEVLAGFLGYGHVRQNDQVSPTWCVLEVGHTKSSKTSSSNAYNSSSLDVLMPELNTVTPLIAPYTIPPEYLDRLDEIRFDLRHAFDFPISEYTSMLRETYPKVSIPLLQRPLCDSRDGQTERVPKLIHWVWLGGKLPRLSSEWMLSHIRTHAKYGYTFYLWYDHRNVLEMGPHAMQLVRDAERLVNKHQFKLMKIDDMNIEWIESPVYRYARYQLRSWAIASDIIRIHILKQYGGIYVDHDVYSLKPYESLLATGCTKFMLGYDVGTTMVGANNDIIMTTPDHPIITSVFNRVNEIIYNPKYLALLALVADELNAQSEEESTWETESSSADLGVDGIVGDLSSETVLSDGSLPFQISRETVVEEDALDEEYATEDEGRMQRQMFFWLVFNIAGPAQFNYALHEFHLEHNQDFQAFQDAGVVLLPLSYLQGQLCGLMGNWGWGHRNLEVDHESQATSDPSSTADYFTISDIRQECVYPHSYSFTRLASEWGWDFQDPEPGSDLFGYGKKGRDGYDQLMYWMRHKRSDYDDLAMMVANELSWRNR